MEAIKVIAVNYDSLVRAGVVPDGARTISPSLPRYLIAAAAILAVLAGATMIYIGGRRAARLADARRRRREAGTDARSVLNAGAAGLAQQIIDLDQQYALAGRAKATRKQREFAKQYRKLTGDYTDLLESIATTDDPAALSDRVEALAERGRKLAA